MAAVRARRSLAEMDGWLPGPGAHLRSGAEMEQVFARFPGVVEQTVEVADQCAFNLRLAKPRLPKQRVPLGHTPISWLRELCRRGADERYPHIREEAEARLQQGAGGDRGEGLPGLLPDRARHGRLRPGARASSARAGDRRPTRWSATCCGITAVDPIKYELPFERFLSATREEEPDIDVDFDSDRREEVIQEVYRRYGRHNAAQVANVISYRPKSAVRDMAKALGYSTGQQDAWSKQIDSYASIADADHEIPAPVVELANELLKAPRHLGIHSGGMVLTERPVGEVCPIERGRMDARTVLQWDKDSCAAMGLVKFDFLGLGILAAIQYTLDLVGGPARRALDPADPAQGGGRGLRHALPGRLDRGVPGGEPGPGRHPAPVAAAAVLRPGDRDRADPPRTDPGWGGAPLHPPSHRPGGGHLPARGAGAGAEATLGVPLFQEQLMQIAMTVGGCTGDDADLLRRAMGSKRGVEKIERLEAKLYAGMAEPRHHRGAGRRHLRPDPGVRELRVRREPRDQLRAAGVRLVWLKLHYPGAFLAGLLRAQPMGFYSPQSLVADARRHGVGGAPTRHRASGVHAELEPLGVGDGRRARPGWTAA